MKCALAADFELAEQSSKFFYVIDHFRSKYALDVVAALVFLALGKSNFSNKLNDGGRLSFVEASNIASLASFLGVSRDTVRRRLNDLSLCHLVQRSNTGFVVKDIPAWRELASFAGQVGPSPRTAGTRFFVGKKTAPFC